MPFIGIDWRTPGDKWIRTEFGWKRLSDIRITLNTQIVQQLRNLSSSLGVSSSSSSSRSSSRNSKSSPRQLSRKTSPIGDGEVRIKRSNSSDLACCSHSNSKEREKRLRQLSYMLAQRCISVRTSSRESNHYSTISDAVNKLNFQQALYDENCFPFICKVVILLFESYYWTLSGSLQSTLLRITETAKERVMETRKHSGLVLKMIDKAVATLEKGRQQQMTGFALRSIDCKIKPLLKIKRQLQGLLLEPTRYQRDEAFMSISSLPSDCLRQIVSHLSHPRDVLNLGQTSSRLHSVTEENWVWRELTQHHYGQVDCTDLGQQDIQWKQVFSQQYRLSKGKLRGEMSHAVSLCKICNFVFWKSYGHPCCNETNFIVSAGGDDHDSQQNAAQSAQGLTAEQFLHLFVS